MKHRCQVIFAVILCLHLTACKDRSGSPAQNPALGEFMALLAASEATVREVLTDTKALLQKHRGSPGLHSFHKEFTRDSIGVVSNNRHTLKSNAYVTKGVSLTPALERYIALTDHLEDYWETSKARNGDRISWQYTYHVSSNTIRIYPWQDLSKMFGPSIQWSMVTFFKDMERVREFADKPFCTRPYDDAGGTGLNVSCCSIFNPNGKYESVVLTCTDVSLRKILLSLRKRMATNGQRLKSLLLTSGAPTIAYKKEALFDFKSGQIFYDDNLSARVSAPDLVSLGSFELFNFDVKVEKAAN